MYEAPPCERPAVKVPQRHVEENVYLGNNTALSQCCSCVQALSQKISAMFSERTSNPVVPQRQAAPPPRPSKPLVTTAQIPGDVPPYICQMHFMTSAWFLIHLVSVSQKSQQDLFSDPITKKRESFMCPFTSG